MNILIKLTCLIGLVIAPILGGHEATAEVVREVQVLEVTAPIAAPAPNKEVRIETVKDAEGNVKTIVTTTTGSSVDTKVFEGTEAEVNKQVDEYRR
jgi:K(+)-stimulated pyrophosphate-energized sodium pump